MHHVQWLFRLWENKILHLDADLQFAYVLTLHRTVFKSRSTFLYCCFCNLGCVNKLHWSSTLCTGMGGSKRLKNVSLKLTKMQLFFNKFIVQIFLTHLKLLKYNLYYVVLRTTKKNPILAYQVVELQCVKIYNWKFSLPPLENVLACYEWIQTK